MRKTCPMHTEELISGVRDPETGDYELTCLETSGHAFAGTYSWVVQAERPDLPEMTGLAAELGLDVDVLAIIEKFNGTWIEFGVVEEALAAANPEAFKQLVDRYGHTAIAPGGYTASKFIANQVLSRLAQRGDISLRRERSTGRWSYLQRVSWVATTTPGAWEDRISWESTGKSVSYVPGSNEA